MCRPLPKEWHQTWAVHLCEESRWSAVSLRAIGLWKAVPILESNTGVSYRNPEFAFAFFSASVNNSIMSKDCPLLCRSCVYQSGVLCNERPSPNTEPSSMIRPCISSRDNCQAKRKQPWLRTTWFIKHPLLTGAFFFDEIKAKLFPVHAPLL